MSRIVFLTLISSFVCASHFAGFAREYHVSVQGSDTAKGTRSAPLRTIQRAADVAQPGDVITVHAGVYRERVNPPRGGASARKPIVYQAARGERVEIKGSEPVRNWVQVRDHVWKAVLPNAFFGSFNPYTNLIAGDWFNPKGRRHHTGAVYVDGHWLVEAAQLQEVLAAPGTTPGWMGQNDDFLLNVAWMRPGVGQENARKIPATRFVTQQGIQTAPSDEGGDCIGWINAGDWVCYEGVDLPAGAQVLEFRVASATRGGRIEIRADHPQGKLLGAAGVLHTGGWQSWSSVFARLKSDTPVKKICLSFKAGQALPPELRNTGLWYAEADDHQTTIYAQFAGFNPNERLVEINVRQTVFYPDQPHRDFITVRGFVMSQAATPWAPPTAEQKALIGTHWSRGWVIESNVISYSICSGISLGKHGDQYDNTSADTAEGYVKTIERGLQRGWRRGNIGHHTVRGNTISHCEQTGIVGSLGCAFSRVEGNTIHDVHIRRLFTGAEMAGIKFHGAIDTTIERNHIYRTTLGLWLDWMAQGTRVSRNLFHDNGRDLFMEVNHGPYLVDNNLFLSPESLLDVSEGGAFAHNLFAGKIVSSPEPNRDTPYHPAHSTEVAGLAPTQGGDNRFYNNIFVGAGPAAKGYGLAPYNPRPLPLFTGGNVYYYGAEPYAQEVDPVRSQANPEVTLQPGTDDPHLQMKTGPELKQAQTRPVTTQQLGNAKIPGLPYESPDGSRLRVGVDYFGKRRDSRQPLPGPFERPGEQPLRLRY